MNKQELKQVMLAKNIATSNAEFKAGFKEGMEISAQLLEQLDEPQKPVVPQFVAEWIEYAKKKGDSLEDAFSPLDLYGVEYNEANNWLHVNQETFARAWLDGYEVEKEPVWGIKNANGNYLTKCTLWGKDGVNHRFEYNPSHQLLFTDKEKADAVALLVNGTAEKVAEE